MLFKPPTKGSRGLSSIYFFIIGFLTLGNQEVLDGVTSIEVNWYNLVTALFLDTFTQPLNLLIELLLVADAIPLLFYFEADIAFVCIGRCYGQLVAFLEVCLFALLFANIPHTFTEYFYIRKQHRSDFFLHALSLALVLFFVLSIIAM